MDQHYVPETYLRQFSEDRKGVLYQYLKKPLYNSWTFREVHASRTCIAKDFYDITDKKILNRYNINDERYIENKGFGYEDTLQDFLDTFRNHGWYLTRKDFIFLVETFVSMKHRTKAFRNYSANPEFAKKGLESSVAGTRDHFIDYFSQKYSTQIPPDLSRDFLAGIFDEMIPGIKEEMEARMKTPEFIAETHNHNILHSTQGINDTLKEVANILLSMDFIVVEIQSDEDFFFISDNPGHTKEGLIIHAWHYNSFDSIFFPINSKQVIMFRGHNSLNYILGLRPIRYVVASPLDIDDINYATVRMAEEKVFCESRQYLEHFIKVRKPELEEMVTKRDGKLL